MAVVVLGRRENNLLGKQTHPIGGQGRALGSTANNPCVSGIPSGIVVSLRRLLPGFSGDARLRLAGAENRARKHANDTPGTQHTGGKMSALGRRRSAPVKTARDIWRTDARESRDPRDAIVRGRRISFRSLPEGGSWPTRDPRTTGVRSRSTCVRIRARTRA